MDIPSNLQYDLCLWAKDCKIPLAQITKLLKVLHKYHQTLPLCATTLLKTSSVTVNSTSLANGQFSYIGIEKYLASFNTSTLPSALSLRVNIDGLPLYKSSGTGFWPILGFIEGVSNKPFLIALFCGTGKPDLDIYLGDFVKEVCKLQNDGFQHDNAVT